jgi:formate/nitrite transporter
MSYKTPQEIAVAAVASGESKARLSLDRMFVGAFLAGAYIAFGSLLAIVVTSGVPKEWGGFTTLLYGAVFSVGLMLVVIGGAELVTGNMALVPLAVLKKRATIAQLGVNWTVVIIGNLAGSLVIAYFLSLKTGIIGTVHTAADAAGGPQYARLATVATSKAVTETNWEIFLRAIGCNWLVCLAVWLALAADDVSGKILGIFFPITAFVAMGFDHVVANMFFLPLGHFIGTPGLGWDDVANNLLWAFLGNLVGAGLFVAGTSWFLYLRGREDEGADPYPATAPGEVPASAAR